jgi:acyl carrier protein
MAVPSHGALLEMLQRVLEREFEIPAGKAAPEADLVEDLDLDSVDAVSLVVLLEEETGLELRDDDVKSMRTVASIVEIVRARMVEQAGAGS